MSKFDSGRFSGTRGSKDQGFRTVRDYSTQVNMDKQGKHDPNHKNYQEGKSIMLVPMSEIQELVDRYAGTGQWRGLNREFIKFDRPIGVWKSDKSAETAITSYGVIHYSKSGCHIVPARPE